MRVSTEVWGCESTLNVCFALARFETHVWTACFALARFETHVWSACFDRGLGVRVNVQRVFRVRAFRNTRLECVFRSTCGGASQRSTRVSRSRVSKHTFGVRVSVDVWGCESTMNVVFRVRAFRKPRLECVFRVHAFRKPRLECVFRIRAALRRQSDSLFRLRATLRRRSDCCFARGGGSRVDDCCLFDADVALREELDSRCAAVSTHGSEKEVHLRAALWVRLRPVWGPSRATSFVLLEEVAMRNREVLVPSARSTLHQR